MVLKAKSADAESGIKILKILNSENVRKILEGTSEKPISAEKISKKYNIPLTKVYRWIKKLQDLKLLETTGDITENGRKVRLYKNLVRMIMVNPQNPAESKVRMLGIGNQLSCFKCGSSNCTLEFDNNKSEWSSKCVECDRKMIQTISHKLKEEQQKAILLESISDTHSLNEEKQKVILLEYLIDEKK